MDTLQLTMAARIYEFDQRQGGKEASSVYRGWIWYRNGANRDIEPEGLLREVPTDAFERQQNIVYFYRGRLQAVVSAFNQLQQKLIHSAGTDQEKKELNQLRKLQGEVQKRNLELQGAEAVLGKNPIAIMQAGARQSRAEEAQRLAAWENEIKQVQI